MDTSKTWLIQRLKRPYERTERGDFLVKVQEAFGGGNLQLGDEARDILRDVFSFDYMGAAEFEFGAVPKALSAVAQAAVEKKLVSFEFVLPAAEITPGFWREMLLRDVRRKELDAAKAAGKRAAKRKKVVPGITEITDRTFYVISPESLRSYVPALIQNIASNTQRLKESPRLNDFLDPDPRLGRIGRETVGWLELDHGFFFFSDREMWERAGEVFDVKKEA